MYRGDVSGIALALGLGNGALIGVPTCLQGAATAQLEAVL